MKILFILIAICVFSITGYAVEEIQLTTYYPAPYGDYETVKANEVIAVGPIRSDAVLVRDQSTITDLDPVNIYRGIRVLGQLAMPYTALPAANVTAFTELTDQRLLFAGSGGTFGSGEGADLVKDGSRLGLRSSGRIYLKPGYSGGDDLVVDPVADGRLSTQTVVINGNLLVLSSAGNAILSVNETDPNDPTSGKAAVIINANLYVSDLVTALGGYGGNFNLASATIEDLIVTRNLITETGSTSRFNGELRSDSITMMSPSGFEIKVPTLGAIARFKINTNGTGLELAGLVDKNLRRRSV